MVPAGESSGEHKHGGFGGVEVGKKGVDELEFEAGVDENVVFACGLVGFCIIFEGTGDGGANGDDATTTRLGSTNGADGAVRNVVPFGVHVVILHVVAADGEKSAKPDVECQSPDDNALRFEPSQELLGHIKTGGWSGGGAGLLGPDGLIALAVAGVGVAMKVGRKGDGAVPFDQLYEGYGRLDLGDATAQ